VQQDRLILETGTSPGKRVRREIALADIPAARAFFVALRAALSGDLDTLRREFKLTFDGNEDGWRMALRPNDRNAQQVREIVISGKGSDILVTEVDEQSGDSTQIIMVPIKDAAPDAPPVPQNTPSTGS
jgi:hypothetical protein